MNERIKELAERAGGNPNYKAFRGYFLPPPPDYIDPATVDLEKFAELIVRECNKIMAKQYQGPIPQDVRQMMLVLQEHFGVEE